VIAWPTGAGLKTRLASGEVLVGTFAGLAGPVAVEVAAAAGADWIVLDLEHGAGAEDQVSGSVTAAAAYQVPLLVRIETGARIRVGRVLDHGVAGVMVPRVDNADDAAAAVRALRYPPAGERGVATYNRQGGFGLNPGILQTRDAGVTGVVQVETLGALEDIDAIAKTDGIDVLFIGPVDLSYALGTPLDFAAAGFQEALDTVVAAAERHGVVAGIMAPSGEAAATYADRGFRFVSVASDASILARTFRDQFAQARSSRTGKARRDQHIARPSQ
jgi:2-dehydro-3-deoxyglucarate aldolase/4-hydroxy-2-oxoheptanedioate aldolase